jgi:hypothetical protein
VSEIDGSTLMGSSFETITIEAGNLHFRIGNHFILDFDGLCLVRHFGNDEDIEIPDAIETIGDSSFAWAKCIRLISFGARSRLRLIRDDAFLSYVLCSITIPSSVEEIGTGGFGDCKRLSRVTFGWKSSLRRIGSWTFRGCSSFESFSIPSSVELIGAYCFWDCEHISHLTFENPSYLRELVDLPLKSVSWVDIPDSVEVLDIGIHWKYEPLTVNFGEGSKLDRIKLLPHLGCSSDLIRAFVRIPAHRLKYLRCRREFALQNDRS